MNNKKRMIIIVSIVLVAVLIGAYRIVISNRNKVKSVEIGTVETKDLSQVISVTGNIEAGNKEEIILPTQQKIIEVLASEGQEVNAGEPILKIDATDYEYQLKKYELSLELANIDLQRLLESGSKNNKKSLEDAVRTAEIELSSVETGYNEAKRKYDYNKILYENGAISKEVYEASLNSMNELKNNMELTTIKLDNAKNSLRDFDINNSDQIKGKRNQVESSKVDIANIKDKIEKSTIKSSIKGRIVQLDVKPNQYPTMENSTIIIYDLSQYKATIQVNQYDAVSVGLGQKSSVKVKGIDTLYKGTVSAIGDAAIITQEGTTKEP
ncbi:HlyD family secretion protein, partial [Macellibacteroides fermentans]|uniref:HlyD family secretion protein n=1 Tax=Macellibacteroides fermentans TaxID=879969 RepID=UPI00406C02AE